MIRDCLDDVNDIAFLLEKILEKIDKGEIFESRTPKKKRIKSKKVTQAARVERDVTPIQKLLN